MNIHTYIHTHTQDAHTHAYKASYRAGAAAGGRAMERVGAIHIENAIKVLLLAIDIKVVVE